ncbi:DnaJ-domain-containing protein [Phlegmacium glaucopus]|nr:DnaJ-domain-containing protein [Phlegmacium glaucopus]
MTSASSSSSSIQPNPFPYPLHRNPTPYQIFHLPSTATESDIKARYFELVRLYHPDKVVGTSASSDIAHTRFQAITAAYDVLRGKAPGNLSVASGSANVPYQTTASWRAMRKRRQELYDSGPIDDGMNDRLIIIGVVATIVIALFQIVTLRREALVDIVSRTRRLSTRDEQHQQQATMDERLSLNKQDPDETRPT